MFLFSTRRPFFCGCTISFRLPGTPILGFCPQCVCSDPCTGSAASESPVFGWAGFSSRASSRWPGGSWPLTGIWERGTERQVGAFCGCLFPTGGSVGVAAGSSPFTGKLLLLVSARLPPGQMFSWRGTLHCRLTGVYEIAGAAMTRYHTWGDWQQPLVSSQAGHPRQAVQGVCTLVSFLSH